MTGAELRSLLRQAGRTPNWLAYQIGRSRTQVVRWTRAPGVPAQHEDRVRELLPPIPRLKPKR